METDNILPIPQGKKIAVVGRYADKINVGDHGSSNVFSPYTVTAYEGIKARFGADKVTVYNGCDTKKATVAVKDSEYIVVCVGSDWLQEGEFLVNLGNIKKKPKGSGGDRANLRIPPEDVALIRAMASLGKKLVVNIMGGSAYVINEWHDVVDAIICSFYSGLEGGNALADVISGDVNPGGKLPFTVAKREDDYPPFIHIGCKDKTIEYGYYHGYTLFDKKNIEPEYPFGFGLSYTDFELSDSAVNQDENGISVSVNVKNIGVVNGDEVVQVYVAGKNDKADRPVKLLKGYKRVSVAAGQTVSADITLDIEDIKFFNSDKKMWELDAGYDVFVGNSSRNVKKVGELKF